MYNDYASDPDKTEIKKEILCKYQVMIADLYNIPTDNLKKLVPNFFHKRGMCFIIKICNFTWGEY